MEQKIYIENLVPALGKIIEPQGIGTILKDMYIKYVEEKADLFGEFFLITNEHFFRVEITREEKLSVNYNEISSSSLYDLATFIASGDMPQRMIPANAEVEKRIRDYFGALGIEERLDENSVNFKVAGHPRYNKPTGVVVLDYKPDNEIRECLEYAWTDDKTFLDV